MPAKAKAKPKPGPKEARPRTVDASGMTKEDKMDVKEIEGLMADINTQREALSRRIHTARDRDTSTSPVPHFSSSDVQELLERAKNPRPIPVFTSAPLKPADIPESSSSPPPIPQPLPSVSDLPPTETDTTTVAEVAGPGPPEAPIATPTVKFAAPVVEEPLPIPEPPAPPVPDMRAQINAKCQKSNERQPTDGSQGIKNGPQLTQAQEVKQHKEDVHAVRSEISSIQARAAELRRKLRPRIRVTRPDIQSLIHPRRKRRSFGGDWTDEDSMRSYRSESDGSSTYQGVTSDRSVPTSDRSAMASDRSGASLA